MPIYRSGNLLKTRAKSGGILVFPKMDSQYNEKIHHLEISTIPLAGGKLPPAETASWQILRAGKGYGPISPDPPGFSFVSY
jgi:hypothetical protein